MEPISVIIPTYNRADFLAGAIDSVLAQDYPSFELLVVDDGSRDHTREVVDRCRHNLAARGPSAWPAASAPVIHYLYQENRGPAAARNLGIKQARYDLLAFLDSDDRWRPGKLHRQAAAMAAQPAIPLAHTEEIWWRNGKHLNQKKHHRKAGGDIFARSLELCVVGMSTVMLRRRVLETIGYFDETLPCCEDYDLWLRLSARYPVLFIEQPLTEKQGGRPDQVSVQYRQGMDRFRITALLNLLQSRILNPAQAELTRHELARKARIYGQGCRKHGREQEARHYLKLADQQTRPLAP